MGSIKGALGTRDKRAESLPPELLGLKAEVIIWFGGSSPLLWQE